MGKSSPNLKGSGLRDDPKDLPRCHGFREGFSSIHLWVSCFIFGSVDAHCDVPKNIISNQELLNPEVQE